MSEEAILKAMVSYVRSKNPNLPADEIARKVLNFADAMCGLGAPAKPPFADRNEASQFSPRQRKLLFNDKGYDYYDGWYGHAAMYDEHKTCLYVAWDEITRTVETGKTLRHDIGPNHDLVLLHQLCNSRFGPVMPLERLFAVVPRVTKKIMTTHRYFIVTLDEEKKEYSFDFSRAPVPSKPYQKTCVDMDYMNDIKSIFTEDPRIIIRNGLWIFTRWIGVHLTEEKK